MMPRASRTALRALWYAIVLSGACCGCSTTQSAPPVSSPPLGSQPGSWRLVYRLTGGFAGFDRELALASSGETVATDHRSGNRVEARASVAELTRIATLIQDLKSTTSIRNDCRDCFDYHVEIQKPGETVILHFNDLALAGKLADLATILNGLFDRVVAPPAAR